MRADHKAHADAAQIRREQMIVLHSAGRSYEEIAKRFGITATRVRQLIRDGLDHRTRHELKGTE